MVKKFFPVFLILVVWLIFSKPFFFDNKIPYPSDFQVNHFSLWNVYQNYWSPVKNPAQPDVVSQIFPWKHLTIESWKNSIVPLWNPYSFSGTPHLANYQSSSFSITNIFFFLFKFTDAWSLAVLIQPLFAGIFMYLFIRSLKLSQFAGLFSAFSFMFCGFITTWMSYTTLPLAISFLPLALFSVEKYLDTKKSRFLLLLSLSFPLSFFSGHFQISIYFALFVLGYIIFKYFIRKNLLELINLLSFSFFGFLLSAPQVLPSIELYLESFRSSIFQKINAISLTQLTTIISPDFYGNPVTGNNSLGNYAETSSFLGVIPFFLAIYGIFSKSKNKIFFLVAAALSLLFCLDTPILNLFVNLKIPVLSTASLSRILVILSFSFAVLAAYGIDQLSTDLTNKKIRKVITWILLSSLSLLVIWFLIFSKHINPLFYSIAKKNMILPTLLFAISGSLILLGLFKQKLIKVCLIVLILLTIFDVARFAIKWQSFSSKDPVFPNTPIITKLSNLDNIYRTYGAFGAEGSVYYHVPSTEGYDPLYINRYGEFLGSLTDGVVKPSYRLGVTLPINSKYLSKALDLMGIKYILVKKIDLNKPWSFPIKKYPENKFSLIYSEKSYLLYQNNDVFPRAFLVGGYAVIADKQKIINKMFDKNFNLRKQVVIEKSPGIKPVKDFSGNADIVKYSPNKIEINTNSNNASLLMLTDNYYPGWKARVNGSQTEILRVDYTFRAVKVPKGKNKVEFYYDPDSFKWGVIISLFSLSSIFISLLRKWYTIDRYGRNKTRRKNRIIPPRTPRKPRRGTESI